MEAILLGGSREEWVVRGRSKNNKVETIPLPNIVRIAKSKEAETFPDS